MNAIERAMNEISGIELADNVLRSCCFATASAGTQIRCTTDSAPQNVSLATLTGLSKIHTAGDYYHIPEAWFSEAVCEYNFE